MDEYVDQFPELSSDPKGLCEYFVRTPVPSDFASRLVSQLPPDRELSFHDPYYPSPSDPGAYVDVRQNCGCFIYCLGNHGWHRGWERQSREFLASYLALCLAGQSAGGGASRLSVCPIEPVEIRTLLTHRPA